MKTNPQDPEGHMRHMKRKIEFSREGEYIKIKLTPSETVDLKNILAERYLNMLASTIDDQAALELLQELIEICDDKYALELLNIVKPDYYRI